MLVLPATLTAVEARDTLSMLTQSIEREPDSGVTVDASGLRQLDSASLAVLLAVSMGDVASGCFLCRSSSSPTAS